MEASLALVGFGHVGQRFALLLAERRDWLRQAHRIDCRIVGVSTARHGSIFNAEGIDPHQVAAMRAAGQALGQSETAFDLIGRLGASRAGLKIVIETSTLSIRDGQPAIAHVEAALDAGCHAITANKGPASFAYRRLSDRAERAGLSFLFEGAVMDGVPIFNLVRETMPGVVISGFRGIVNTTTQHVLAALERGDGFAEAVARMQAEGIAEADPSLDLEGWDAAAKAAALANVLMDADLTPHAVDRDPIGPETATAAQAALASGRRLRLVAAGRREGGTVRASVRLIAIESSDILATLPHAANALVLSTDLLGDVAICQLSGNVTQTAYALLSDVVTMRRRLEGARS